ncbi:type VI secretion system-associated FHA domain protein TagH [Novosphingobium terrae]|uniref:type VI secretion system-associated FHA domain protein TagH n=1 Tax=Novosphingobium terrae TaxID=2726189 RepID=UPI001980EA84|nr:type VI secretion system-associated FHA domain protein TagH [Novosphingobium terrae]
MTLRLSIVNASRSTLDNGAPTEFSLDQRGALIGRSPGADWSLPDPRNHISSRHCEIRFEHGHYVLHDTSTNGTFLNDRTDRLTQQHMLQDGDVLNIGHYRIRVTIAQGARPFGSGPATTSHHQSPPPAASGWDSWGTPQPASPSPPFPAADSGWGAPAASKDAGWNPLPPASEGWGAPPPAAPVSSDWGTPTPPASQGWGPPPSSADGWGQAPQSASDGWGSVPVPPPVSSNDSWAPASGAASPSMPEVSSPWASATPAPPQASGWSSAAPDRPPAPAPDDIWGRLAEGNVVDWARGGFGQPIDSNPDPLGLNPQGKDVLGVAPANPFDRSSPWSNTPPAPTGAPVADMHFAMPPVQDDPLPVAVPQAPTPVTPAPPPAPAPDVLIEAFLRAAGVEHLVTQRNPALLERAGKLFHRLVAGLVVMVEARARAKSQMGAQATAFEVDGNNPIKFSRHPEDAITALLNAPARGFLDAGPAIEEAFFDLQSHQLATLRAMQGALRTTLDRFSPSAIRKRAEHRGLLARILPSARDAALWQAYEKEFGGVAQGSDEAFMDMFAKEFRRAYEEQVRERQSQR